MTEPHEFRPDPAGLCLARVVSATDVGPPFVCGMDFYDEHADHFRVTGSANDKGWDTRRVEYSRMAGETMNESVYVVYEKADPFFEPYEAHGDLDSLHSTRERAEARVAWLAARAVSAEVESEPGADAWSTQPREDEQV